MLQRSSARSGLFGTLLLSATLGCAGPAQTNDWRDSPKTDPKNEVHEDLTNSPVGLHGALHVDGTVLKDQNGIPVQLKGVSSMWLQWQSAFFSESVSGLRYMRDTYKVWAIRAAMGTDADNGYLTSPENMTALAEGVIKTALRLGLYVLVDWHTEKAVDQQAEAIEFFTNMAQKYGEYPNVIWETYNEPAGYQWTKIKAYHEAVVDAIRAVDPDNLIILGTGNWSQDVDVAAANPVSPTSGTANLMYTLHFYACTHGQKFRDKAITALNAGIPIFVTEFGATPSDGGVVSQGDNYVCRDESNRWFDWMAQNNISGIAWKLERGTDSSCILGPKVTLGGPWTYDLLTTDASNTTQVTTPTGTGTKGGGHGQFIADWLMR